MICVSIDTIGPLQYIFLFSSCI